MQLIQQYCSIKINGGYSQTLLNLKELQLHNELYLFYSDNLLSQNWKSHPMNPVISDVKRARPAGKILELNGNTISSITVLHSLVWVWDKTQ